MRRGLGLSLGMLMLVGGIPVAAVATGAAPESVEGELERLAIELPDGGALELALVVPDSGDAVRLEPEAVAEVPTGASIEVVVDAADAAAVMDVTDVGGEVAVQDLEVLDVPEESVPVSGAGETTQAEVLASVAPGGRGTAALTGYFTGTSLGSIRASTIANEIGGAVNQFWRDSTGGALGFSVVRTLDAGSLGAPPAVCDAAFVWSTIMKSAQLGQVQAAGPVRHSVLYTPALGACRFAGVAQVSDGGAAWINGATSRISTIAHELGHTLTLGHSNSRVQCPEQDGAASACLTGEYGDAYDVMGTSGPTNAAGPLSGAQLDLLGLVPAGSMVQVDASQRVTLQAVGGLAGLRFMRFTAGDATYYVEYRGRVGRDADLGASGRYGCPRGVSACPSVSYYLPGVVVRRVDGSGVGEETLLLDADTSSGWFALDAGESFVTADRSVTVRVASTTTSTATLDVTLGRVTPTTPYEQVVISPNLIGARAGDTLTVDQDGRLFLHPGRGDGRLSSPIVVGDGWAGLDVFAPGDWNGDARHDIVATDDAGDLWLYPGTGTGGFRARVKIGHGWQGYRIIPAGDVNGDGPVDLLGIDPGGLLWLYPGAGNGAFGRRIQVGRGWGTFDLYAAGDMNFDRRVDILGINSAGQLFFYAGRGGGYFRTAVQVGRGWSGFVFASGADLNADGLNDLMGRDRYGSLWYYAGRGYGRFKAAVKVATGW